MFISLPQSLCNMSYLSLLFSDIFPSPLTQSTAIFLLLYEVICRMFLLLFSVFYHFPNPVNCHFPSSEPSLPTSSLPPLPAPYHVHGSSSFLSSGMKTSTHWPSRDIDSPKAVNFITSGPWQVFIPFVSAARTHRMLQVTAGMSG